MVKVVTGDGEEIKALNPREKKKTRKQDKGVKEELFRAAQSRF